MRVPYPLSLSSDWLACLINLFLSKFYPPPSPPDPSTHQRYRPFFAPADAPAPAPRTDGTSAGAFHRVTLSLTGLDKALALAESGAVATGIVPYSPRLRHLPSAVLNNNVQQRAHVLATRDPPSAEADRAFQLVQQRHAVVPVDPTHTVGGGRRRGGGKEPGPAAASALSSTSKDKRESFSKGATGGSVVGSVAADARGPVSPVGPRPSQSSYRKA